MRGMRVLMVVLVLGSWGCVEEKDASIRERSGHEEAAAGEANVSAPTTQLQLEVSGSGVRLSRESVPAGTVSLEIQNAAPQPVTVQVRGAGQSWSSNAVSPGERVLLSMVLGAGSYQITTTGGAASAPLLLQVQ